MFKAHQLWGRKESWRDSHINGSDKDHFRVDSSPLDINEQLQRNSVGECISF